uniref:Uncharacterized protein n=1 Tax=Mycena chlorophos TaxID=658473 RepID=A0ABQ0MAY2_MYCCL|nr:predicted protein [Mycena chlorophos]
MRTSIAAVTLALAGAASAATSTNGLSILAPGGQNLWWLQGQDNNIAWTCGESTISQFTIWLNNTDVTTTIGDITALIAVEQNYNCVQLVSAGLNNAPVGSGYTIVMTDISNANTVYAVSDPFEIQALSVGYPPASNTPTDSASATVVKGTSAVVTGSAASSGSSAKATSAALPSRSLNAAGVVGAAFLGALGLAL